MYTELAMGRLSVYLYIGCCKILQKNIYWIKFWWKSEWKKGRRKEISIVVVFTVGQSIRISIFYFYVYLCSRREAHLSISISISRCRWLYLLMEMTGETILSVSTNSGRERWATEEIKENKKIKEKQRRKKRETAKKQKYYILPPQKKECDNIMIRICM